MIKNLPAAGAFALIAFIIGLNLRPVMAAIGPLFSLLHQDMQLSGTQLSLLTTLPVFMMGAAALAGPSLINRLGEVRGIALGLLILMLSCLTRGMIHSVVALIMSALVAGMGIGLIQSMMPALIKRRYGNKAGTLMALFSTGIMAGAAMAAVTATPLADTLGLQGALVVPFVPALLALLIWKTRLQGEKTLKRETPPRPRLPRQATLLMIFFGIGTGAYTLVLAWLPPFYIQHGWSPRLSGYLLGALTLTEVVAGFVLSSTIHYFQDRRRPLVVVLCLILAGLVCLIMLGGAHAWLPTMLLGLGIGALFPLSLIVTLDHAKTPEEAGLLLSFVQGGGYMIASLMPLIAGIVRDHADSLNSAWGVMCAGIVLLILIAVRFTPPPAARA